MKQLFHIYKFTEADAEKVAASENEPHQHDFEELLVGMDGSLEHFIDFTSEEVDAPYISFVTKGKVHRVVPKIKNGKCNIWVLRFKSEFIPETTFQLYSWYHGYSNIKLQADRCFSRMPVLCEMMFNETLQPDPDFAVIRHLLIALFIMIESERKKLHPAMKKSIN